MVNKTDRVPVFKALTSSRRRETKNRQRNKKMKHKRCFVGKNNTRAETVNMEKDSLWMGG